MTSGEIAHLQTRSGFRLSVRTASTEDETKLAKFFKQVGPEDLRFCFLSTVRNVSHDRLVAMVDPDSRTDSVIAENEEGEIVAAAMLAGDQAGDRGEVAVSIRGDHKGRGIGWTLLDYLVAAARAWGYASIESIEDRQNRAAIALEQEMGFVAQPVDGEPTLILVRKSLS
ncbi:GNAT family N-acetyltransferase [Sphingomonas beigongshangi]|uniref:GNAT family N-acetyltransferase n=1 Tax=Sphingomonas beigongshangi TaxID=2782540 RepID=UPI001AED5183|nr:GNAT family N-acetyltransferase [Sphingomonas beigongshangi]